MRDFYRLCRHGISDDHHHNDLWRSTADPDHHPQGTDVTQSAGRTASHHGAVLPAVQKPGAQDHRRSLPYCHQEFVASASETKPVSHSLSLLLLEIFGEE